MNRRDFLGLAVIPLAQALDRQPIRRSRGAVIGVDGARIDGVELIRDWTGPLCRARLVNRTSAAVQIKEVVLFDVELNLPAATGLYGEGFQMLTQTAGTLATPLALSQYTDAKHYRIPTGDATAAYYGLLTLTPPGADTQVFALTSCARFSGRFEFRGSSLRAVIDAEGLALAPGETWPLEELMVDSGSDRSRLLANVAGRLAIHHPPPRFASPPTGWCSWYCFGPNVTSQQLKGVS